jgi:hypothetical protein
MSDDKLLAAMEEGSMRLELMQVMLADIQQGNCALRKRLDALSLSVSRLSQARSKGDAHGDDGPLAFEGEDNAGEDPV